MSAALEQCHTRVERVTAEWAKSFYFASRFLPAAKRRAIFALYDFCRHADNLVDERGAIPVDTVREDLRRLELEVRQLHAGDPPSDARWLALHDTMQRFPVPLEPLVDLIHGVAIDLGPVEFESFTELQEYSRLVAGGVGLMLGPVLGAHGHQFRDSGIGLGIAMQLTNVLRDVAEDLERGRVYLPRTELVRFGLTREDLARGVMTPDLTRFMAFQVGRARRAFEDADVVVGLFPGDGSRLTVRLLQQTYAGILDVIEARGYDVFTQRVYTTKARKLGILARAVWDERRLTGMHPTQHSA